jgi:hypothetical protein
MSGTSAAMQASRLGEVTVDELTLVVGGSSWDIIDRAYSNVLLNCIFRFTCLRA